MCTEILRAAMQELHQQIKFLMQKFWTVFDVKVHTPGR